MTTLQEAVVTWTRRFEEEGIATARLDARALVLHVAGLSREDFIADPDRLLSADEAQEFEALAARRAEWVPLAHLTGEKEFWSLNFKVTPDTLIPRPETELLVELGIEALQGRKSAARILDLGTGSGCILLALLSELRNASGLGIDVSDAALAVAEENAERLGFADRAQFAQGNWTEGLEGVFDLIVSNPPYIADEDPEVAADVRAHEPAGALFGGLDGLDPMRGFLSGVKRLLSAEGHFIMEYGAGQTPLVREILSSEGFDVVNIAQDLAKIDRAVVARVAKM